MSKQIKLLIQAENETIKAEFENERDYLERFCNPSELIIATKVDVPEKAMSAVITGAELFLPLEGLIDFDKEIARLEKELLKWQKEVERVQKQLANEGFVKKAPQVVVDEEKQKEQDYLEKHAKVNARLAELQGEYATKPDTMEKVSGFVRFNGKDSVLYGLYISEQY